MPNKPNIGKIEKDGQDFVLMVNGTRYPVPSDLVAQNADLEKLVGTELEVMFSEPKPFVVALRKVGRPPFMCYLPPPDWFHVGHWAEHAAVASNEAQRFRVVKPTCYLPAEWMIHGVEEKVRLNLANQMLKQGIISQDVHAQITK